MQNRAFVQRCHTLHHTLQLQQCGRQTDRCKQDSNILSNGLATTPKQHLQSKKLQDSWTNPHLLVSVHEVHDAVMVVVVVHILGCIHGQHEVVGSQPIPLCVSVTEDTRLQHLVITVSNTCSADRASWLHSSSLNDVHALLSHVPKQIAKLSAPLTCPP